MKIKLIRLWIGYRKKNIHKIISSNSSGIKILQLYYVYVMFIHSFIHSLYLFLDSKINIMFLKLSTSSSYSSGCCRCQVFVYLFEKLE